MWKCMENQIAVKLFGQQAKLGWFLVEKACVQGARRQRFCIYAQTWKLPEAYWDLVMPKDLEL